MYIPRRYHFLDTHARAGSAADGSAYTALKERKPKASLFLLLSLLDIVCARAKKTFFRLDPEDFGVILRGPEFAEERYKRSKEFWDKKEKAE